MNNINQYLIFCFIFPLLSISLFQILYFFFFLLISGIILCLLGNLLMRLYIYRHNPDNEKSSSYECGFFPKNDAPIKHEISFYTVGLTFLIFDLELLLIFPFVFSIIYATTVSSQTVMIFLILLGLDFFYELYYEVNDQSIKASPIPHNIKQLLL